MIVITMNTESLVFQFPSVLYGKWRDNRHEAGIRKRIRVSPTKETTFCRERWAGHEPGVSYSGRSRISFSPSLLYL